MSNKGKPFKDRKDHFSSILIYELSDHLIGWDLTLYKGENTNVKNKIKSRILSLRTE